jgi:guanylate kinase
MTNTIIAICGKTCSGKTHILNQLLSNNNVSKLVTSTNRDKREGEVEGEDYYFITQYQAHDLIERNQFIEFNFYGGKIYGLTKDELNKKLHKYKVPCVILTPEGAISYKELLLARGIDVKTIFIDCPQDILVDRLVKRTLKEKEISEDVLKSLIDRTITMTKNEQNWRSKVTWDLIVTADDQKITESVKNFISPFTL